MTVPVTAGRTQPYTPPSLEKHRPKVIFYLRVPNWDDRDNIAMRMFRMGVRQIQQGELRALMLSELFQIMPEDKADEKARFLEGFWQRADLYELEISNHSEQESIRIIEASKLKRKFVPNPAPPENTTVRERAESTVLLNWLKNESETLRHAMADQLGYDARFKVMVARIQLAGWTGLKTPAIFDHDEVLAPECIEGLRTELFKVDPTGDAWRDLVRDAEAMYALPRSAEKNLPSPPESGLLPDGSISQISGSDTIAGSSNSREPRGSLRGSRSKSIPAGGSQKTTDRPSGSSKGVERKKPKSGPTGGQ